MTLPEKEVATHITSFTNGLSSFFLFKYVFLSLSGTVQTHFPKAGMFYVPRLLWKTAEGGVMKLLTVGLSDITAFMNKDARRDGVDLIAKYYNMKYVSQSIIFFFLAYIIIFAVMLAVEPTS